MLNRATACRTWFLLCLVLTVGRTEAASPPATSPAAPPQTSPTPPGLPNCPTAASCAPPGQTPATGFLDRSLMTGDWGGLRKTLEDDGMKFAPTYTAEVLGNPSGGARHGAIFEGLLNLPLDFDLERMSDGGVDGLTIHANAYYIHGPGLSAQFVGDFSNTSNIAAYNTIRLQELWLQKGFWGQRLSIKAGNLAVDCEYFQSSSGALFLNGTFGAFTLLANNVGNAPVYPLASPGVRLQFLPTPSTYAMAGVYGMDTSSNPATNNQHGTRFALTASSGILALTEAGYLLNQGPKDQGLPGTYRLGSFVHTANYDNWGSQAANNLGTGNLQSAGVNYGIYGVMDQQIYAKDTAAISFFVRSGGAPSKVNFVDWYVDGGFNFTGFVPGRASDVAGIAVARSHVSRNFSDSQIAQGEEPFTAETVIEATYKVQLAPWWSVQPDVQYIVTPSGELGSHNATVLGVRTSVAF